jgi:hypothetical protein
MNPGNKPKLYHCPHCGRGPFSSTGLHNHRCRLLGRRENIRGRWCLPRLSLEEVDAIMRQVANAAPQQRRRTEDE